MSMRSNFLGAISLSFFALGMQIPARAQTSDSTELEQVTEVSLANEQLTLDETEPAFSNSADEDSAELAQARRRTRSATVRGSDFIGIGADFGYADDVSFAVISKISINDQIAVRPSVLVGNDFAVLVPVTYEFSQFAANAGGLQLRPYAGAGVSYSDGDDNSDINLLLSAGVDVPISRQFTLNGQANLGVLNDTDFGVTVGVGYNFGGFR